MAVITESSLVVPFEETPKQTIWLSNLDLVMGNWYTTTATLYRHNGDSDFFSIEPLKLALSKALVHFYPYAGRLVYGENSRPEIECNGEGVRFIVARSAYTVDEFEPSEEMGKKLVPEVDTTEPPFMMLMLQVTFLKCGGVSLGVAVHHAAGDGRCTYNFINTWSQIARGSEPKSLTLSFDRTKLRARYPPKILYNLPEYQLIKPIATSTTTETVTAILGISKQQLHSLKSIIFHDHTNPPTTFKAVLAHVWRCTCKAWEIQSDEETSIFTQADIRSRMVPRLPENFFGNPLVRTSVKANAGDLLRNSLQFAADKINEAIVRVNEEYVRSVIDTTEVNVVKSWNKYRFSTSETKNCLYVVSWLHLPLYEADFSWGKPMLMSRSHTHSQSNSMVYFMQNPNGDGGVRVVMALEPKSMARFKSVFYDDLKGLSVSAL